jgi:hypothetical protein
MRQQFPHQARLFERLAFRKWRSTEGKLESRKGSFIGQKGYITRLTCLPSNLARFNDKIVKPNKLQAPGLVSLSVQRC